MWHQHSDYIFDRLGQSESSYICSVCEIIRIIQSPNILHSTPCPAESITLKDRSHMPGEESHAHHWRPISLVHVPFVLREDFEALTCCVNGTGSGTGGP